MAVHRYLLHNSDLVETSAKSVSPGQVGLLNGWGVFSTLRVKDGVLFAWERHLARMRTDAAAMNVPFPLDAEALRASLLRLVEANGALDSTLRVVIVRNRGGQFEGAGIDRDWDLVAFTKDTTRWGPGCRLTVTPQARHSGGQFAGTKILSWSLNLALLEQAQQRGFDETILLDSRGLVSECTSANIFAVFGGDVVTPPRLSACLPGITRAILLEEIQVPGLKAAERDLTLEDLRNADQVFITSSTRNLLKVLEIDGAPVASRGDSCERLSSAFQRYLDEYVARATVRARPVLA